MTTNLDSVNRLLAVPGPTVPAMVLGLTEPCWRCHAATTTIVGMERRDGAVVWTRDGEAKLVAAALLRATLADRRVGEARERLSHRDGLGIFNGCASCDAVIPDSVLFDEALREVLELDGLAGLVRLADVTLPGVLWSWLDSGAPELVRP